MELFQTEIKIRTDKKDNEKLIDSETIALGFDINHKSLCETLQKHFSRLKRLNIDSGGSGRPKVALLLNERQISILPALVRPTERTIAFQTRLVDAFLALREEVKQIKELSLDDQTELIAKGYLRVLEEKRQLETQLEKDKPLVDFANRVKTTDDLIEIGSWASLYNRPGFGRNNIFQILRQKGILIAGGDRKNEPKRTYLDAKWFECKEILYEKKDKDGNTTKALYLKTMLTGKGQIKLVELLEGL